jgi:hypothetical protein
MNKIKPCAFPECALSPVATLDSERLCRGHFISVCYERLDRYNEICKGTSPSVTETESMRRFIQESTRCADSIEYGDQNLDNLERAKLLHIILSASELGRHLRRSPRKVATIRIKLTSEKIGAIWEEETETVLVSRHGALVRCKHPAKAGETLHFKRADTGKEAYARVAWQRPLSDDDVRIGVEFLACENFWGLDWGAVEEAR